MMTRVLSCEEGLNDAQQESRNTISVELSRWKMMIMMVEVAGVEEVDDTWRSKQSSMKMKDLPAQSNRYM
jgi:hypothetical protein